MRKDIKQNQNNSMEATRDNKLKVEEKEIANLLYIINRKIPLNWLTL